MRTLAPILLLVGIFIVISIWSSHYLDRTAAEMVTLINNTESFIKSEDWDEASFEITKTQNKWSRVKNWWAIIIDHAEIDHIEISLARLSSFTQTRESSSTLAEVAELKKLINHIPDKELLNLHNIL